MKKLAIVAAGGPAPGINSVIGAATIRARNSGVEVLGLRDGFKWLAEGDTDHVLPLTIAETSRLHFRGGSHIGISRANPSRTPETLQRTIDALKRLDVGMLLTIGGDGTAALASVIAENTRGEIRVVHVPKTIDNDIDLPRNVDTFGFQTARHIGVELVKNLMVDAKTTSRWYFVVAQGRKAGHLALGIGKAVGATITLIPEEFRHGTPLQTVVDTLTGAIIKRLAMGRGDGVAMIAEGVADAIRIEDLAAVTEVPLDASGNLHVASIDLGAVLTKAVRARLAGIGIRATVVPKEIGYEVRCADPIPADMEYTRDLGYSAAKHLIEGGSEVMVAMVDGKCCAIPFSQLRDPATGRSRVRLVDLTSDRYRIARAYMLRLRPDDFRDERALASLAGATQLTPQQFREQFSSLVAEGQEIFSAHE